MQDQKLAIWWVSEDEIQFILAHFKTVPSYVRTELDSAQGRPKRGRLWVPSGIEFDSVASDNLLLDSAFIGARAGIVVHAEDVRTLQRLPGWVTDTDLRAI